MEYVITPSLAEQPSPFAYWENAFNDEELSYLRNIAKNSTSRAVVNPGTSMVSGGMLAEEKRRSNVTWLHYEEPYKWIFKKLSHVVAFTNSKYFRYNLTGFGEPLQLTNYDSAENGMYGWHQDMGRGFCRKLSLTLQLTDPSEYEGGNFQMLWADEKPITIRKQLGLIVLFPSFALHQVTPVTQGTRQSLVSWISGEPFK